ncbi:putative phage repressor [Clostridium aceticum]|uniref:Putative phage repressor n=1 Tax=Clostridium aceticum TaxID=84022 RepID=A0A0D8I6J6_9CLOT|nr:helix-turn-helix transcriptional regulator [Clostridium aceticum]AKL96662.1 putative phage repressor [Clostridium aceticum]KJF25900.1 hypothetical protein TZ02_16070 [Clostridium aceticum]
MDFKDKVKNRRLELGLTLEEVAKIVGVSAPTIQRYETGEIKNIRRDKIKLLADALQVSPAYLMDWDELTDKNKINKKSNLDDDDVFTRAAHKVGHDGPLTEEEKEKIALAIKIALMKNKE